MLVVLVTKGARFGKRPLHGETQKGGLKPSLDEPGVAAGTAALPTDFRTCCFAILRRLQEFANGKFAFGVMLDPVQGRFPKFRCGDFG